MIVKNKLDQSFGPVGTSAGILVFFAGVGTVYFSMYSVFMILIGAFVGFSYSVVYIDLVNRRLRFSNNLFGILPTGKWIKVKPEMKIGIKKSNRIYRSFSQGNRALEIENLDYRLILYDFKGVQIMPVKKTNTLSSAKSELERICKQLDVSPIS